MKTKTQLDALIEAARSAHARAALPGADADASTNSWGPQMRV